MATRIDTEHFLRALVLRGHFAGHLAWSMANIEGVREFSLIGR